MGSNLRLPPEGYEEIDLLDVLLDQENTDPIALAVEDGRIIRFEQVAVIPMKVNDENVLHCLLRPIDEIEGVGPDQAILFYLDMDDDGNDILAVQSDEGIMQEAYQIYLDLLSESDE
ncbi:MAG: hypothetical protein IKB27_01895 [Clostridia bacterium]|nr:hypothetical protein [Clostridia bacterium]